MEQQKYSEFSDEELSREILSLQARANVLEGRIARPKDYPTDDPSVDAISLRFLKESLDEMHREQERRRRSLS